jgi:hypothetical protein
MPTNRVNAVTATLALGFAALFLGIAPAHGDPQGCPKAATVDDEGCFGRFASVTANTTDGTITGTLVGGQSPITLTGSSDVYLKSTGYAGTPPDPVQQWDATLDRVNALPPPGVDDPNWYASGKSRVFLPRELNDLAAKFPPDSLVIKFVPDETPYSGFRMLSIQPTG